MKDITAIAIAMPVGVILAMGCAPRSGPAPEREHEEREDHHDDHDRPGEHPAPEHDVVRVERGMLRDLRITTRAAESRPAGEAVTVLGEIRVNEDAYAEVGTSMAARVSHVLVGTGDSVRAGQALVELDSAEIGRARAEVIAARARLELARQNAERRRALAAEQIVPQREAQAADAELTEAEALSRAAEQGLLALGAVEGVGSRIVLTSPIAGTILDRSALLGQTTDSARPLFVVGNLAKLWLVVHVFERDALRIKVPAKARVTLPALPGESVTGVATRVGSRVDPSSRTVDVRIELDNPTGVLRPGMSAAALLALGDSSESVVAVPVEALQRHPQGWCVFVTRSEEGEFEMRPVGRGRDLHGEVEILSGLRAGEQIVVEGAFLLKVEADKARGGGNDEHHH